LVSKEESRASGRDVGGEKSVGWGVKIRPFAEENSRVNVARR